MSDTATGSYRLPRFADARVADVMRAGTISCDAGTPVREAARTMATQHVHAIVVGRDDGRWGLLSDLDLVRAMRGELREELTAGEVAGRDVFTVTSEDALARAADLMAAHGLCHLVVVEGGHPVGMLSSLDLAGALAWGEA